MPAASISSASAIPCSSIAQRSTARISSASKSGAHQPWIATAAAKSREWVSETSIALPRRRIGGPAGDPHRRRLAGEDLDLAQAEAAGQAERLDDRLLGGEAGRQMAARAGAGRGIATLGLGEDPLGQTRMALQRPLQPADLQQVDAYAVGQLPSYSVTPRISFAWTTSPLVSEPIARNGTLLR